MRAVSLCTVVYMISIVINKASMCRKKYKYIQANLFLLFIGTE